MTIESEVEAARNEGVEKGVRHAVYEFLADLPQEAADAVFEMTVEYILKEYYKEPYSGN